MATRVTRVSQVFPVSKVHQVAQVPRVRMVCPVHQVHREQEVKAEVEVHVVCLDPPGLAVPRVDLVQEVHLETTADQVPQVHPVLQVHQAIPEVPLPTFQITQASSTDRRAQIHCWEINLPRPEQLRRMRMPSRPLRDYREQ